MIGLARIVSDRAFIATIEDLVVDPMFQGTLSLLSFALSYLEISGSSLGVLLAGQGYGRKMTKFLIEHVRKESQKQSIGPLTIAAFPRVSRL